MDGASILSALCGTILSIIIFIYLLTPNVRQAFRVSSQTPEAVEPPSTVKTAIHPKEVVSGEPTDSEEPASPVEPAAAPESPETDETAEPGDEVEQ
ncbi:MAG: hypothetical protein MUO67_19345 [Anaerolineales bacterium]|nr:hypothetical protein [Anaerolineales bacterium]